MTGVEVLDNSQAAPPRDNGELVFEAPWQSRAFGVVADLVDSGSFSWNDFRQQLIGAIQAWEALDSADQPPWDYYTCWVAALEQLLFSKVLVDPTELDLRSSEYVERPHGHDH
ncbi:MAG: nitrile hydratase accessory protein [Actinomycetota bacterium]|nr:nitrile hydratase accessory protein [Actinomycetota bacterium]